MANTRQVLERIPADKLGWKAHEKSNTIGWVAAHVADIPKWPAFVLTQDSLDLLDDPDARLVADNTVEMTTFLGELHAAGRLRTDFRPLADCLQYSHHRPIVGAAQLPEVNQNARKNPWRGSSPPASPRKTTNQR